MKKHEETNQQVIDIWKSGGIVATAELGGISPAYEQCIQILLWEIFSSWDSKLPVVDDKGRLSPEYNNHVELKVSELQRFGFSGAQFQAAKHTAFQFIHYGYSEMMNKLPDDRHIQCSRNFPSLDS